MKKVKNLKMQKKILQFLKKFGILKINGIKPNNKIDKLDLKILTWKNQMKKLKIFYIQ